MPAKKEAPDTQTARRPQYVYILKCADGTLYTGWTTDLKARVAAHNAGKGAKYTRPRRPVDLVYHEEYDDKGTALSREHAIKQLTRAQKDKLIRSAAKARKSD